jgi:hypothetical protein
LASTKSAVKAPAATQVKAKASPLVSALHSIKVGETLEQNIEGHAARTDSKEFRAARATVQKIIATLKPNPYGDGPIQAHHGGSIWLYDGTTWRMVANWAGIEWSVQFCCEPAKVDALRQTAKVITDAFPQTIPQLKKLGYNDVDILTTPITDQASIARYVDSIWNSCVPIPQPGHTGSVGSKAPLAAGVHNYPETMCAIPRVMRSDFSPFHIDSGTQTAAVVVPVAPRGSGDGRVRVVFAEKGHPLAAKKAAAKKAGKALVLSAENPLSKKAFAKQT